MSSWTLENVVQATGARVLSSPSLQFDGVGTDSRSDLTGAIFVALKGGSFDGHDFLPQAVVAGARALLVEEQRPHLDKYYQDVTVVLVPDTLRALQDLALFWRRSLKAQVIAITGSSGKTTTKDFLATLLSGRFKTHKSQGSFNNHWGVPLTLLSTPQESEKVIVEMGMNHSGEITRLCEIARPDTCLVTMVGTAHMGHFQSERDIADAKGELYDACIKATHVYNLDNAWTTEMWERNRGGILSERMYTFSQTDRDADVFLEVSAANEEGLHVKGHLQGVSSEQWVPVFGRHHIHNLMGASCLALAAGVSAEEIWQRLSLCRTSWGRSQWMYPDNGARVLFDAYNANPESVFAALQSLLDVAEEESAGGCQKVAILGEMKELGSRTRLFHERLGEQVASLDLDVVWFIGASGDFFREGLQRGGFSKTQYLTKTYEPVLAKKIGSMLKGEDVVLIKGSRALKLERVLQEWDLT